MGPAPSQTRREDLVVLVAAGNDGQYYGMRCGCHRPASAGSPLAGGGALEGCAAFVSFLMIRNCYSPSRFQT
jgi:hypothetical protein